MINEDIVKKAQLVSDFVDDTSKRIEAREDWLTSWHLEQETIVPSLSKTRIRETIRTARAMLLELEKMVGQDDDKWS